MKIEIDAAQMTFDERFGVIVKCAVCNSNWTHQTSVRMYEREEDDETEIFEFSRKGEVEKITHTQIATDNPSARRHAVGVLFTCEGCASVSELCVTQHKGQTFLYVRPVLIDAKQLGLE